MPAVAPALTSSSVQAYLISLRAPVIATLHFTSIFVILSCAKEARRRLIPVFIVATLDTAFHKGLG